MIDSRLCGDDGVLLASEGTFEQSRFSKQFGPCFHREEPPLPVTDFSNRSLDVVDDVIGANNDVATEDLRWG